jgi:hypothetical protein
MKIDTARSCLLTRRHGHKVSIICRVPLFLENQQRPFPGQIQSTYSSLSAAAFLAFDPRSFFSGKSFFGRWELRMALARAMAEARRSGRYPDLAVLLAIALYVL